MIDPSLRDARIREEVDDPTTAVVLFDVVLGYGSADDPTAGLLGVVGPARAKAKAAGRPVAFIGYVCGTDQDPQNRSKVVAGLKSAGVLVASSNAEAATWSAAAHFRTPEEQIMKTAVSTRPQGRQRRPARLCGQHRRRRRRRHAPELGASRGRRCRPRLDAGQHDRRPAHRASQPHRLRTLPRRPAAAGGSRAGARRHAGLAGGRAPHPALGSADRLGRHVRSAAGRDHRRDPLRGLGQLARGRGSAGRQRQGGSRAVPRARSGRADGRHHQPVDAGVGRGEHRGREPGLLQSQRGPRQGAALRRELARGARPPALARHRVLHAPCRSRCAVWPIRT